MAKKEGKKNRKLGRGMRKPYFISTNHKYRCVASIDGKDHKFFYNNKLQKAVYERVY